MSPTLCSKGGRSIRENVQRTVAPAAEASPELAAREDGPSGSIVYLVTSHRQAAAYLPLVRDTIEVLWPGHPPLRLLTDGGAEGPDVLVENEAEFVPLLARGLARLRSEFPDLTHVFHMLEDHCPLRPCDAGRIWRVFAQARKHDLAAVSFVTYEWPWERTDTTEHADGLVRTWQRIETTTFGGEKFAVVPRKFFRYFQVQPSIWRCDYLERICAEASRRGVTDPWRFEAMLLPNCEQHYVSSYRWPTVHHGFLAQGRINPAAIDFAASDAANMRRRLIKGHMGKESEFLYCLHRLASRGASLARRLIAKLGTRTLTRTP